jgi:ADP-heptose:LPS heptosyltransferase
MTGRPAVPEASETRQSSANAVRLRLCKSGMTPQRLLIVFIERKIGDAIFALPAIRIVRRHFGPGAEIWMLRRQGPTIETASADIISEGAKIDGFISFPENHTLPAIFSLILHLRRMQFKSAVYTDSSGISESKLRRYAYLLRAGGISNLIGFHPHEHLSKRDILHRNSFPQKSEALLRLDNLAMDGMDVSSESSLSSPLLLLPDSARQNAWRWLREKHGQMERLLIAICPGAASPANFWPIERFIEIGRRLLRLGRYEVVVCGGQAEQAMGDRMVTDWGQGVNVAGHLPVLGTASILKECSFMIGLDTGTTHLAAAVGVPCINLQGGRRLPGYWDPLGMGHIVVRHPVNCVGCGRTSCITPQHPCMRGITIEMVWKAVEQMQNSPAVHVKTQGAGH